MFTSRKIIFVMGLLLGGGVVFAPVSAAESPKTEPVKISADMVEVDQKSQSSTYSGNVILRQGDMRLTAETVKVNADRGKLSAIKAMGHPAEFRSVSEDGTPVRGQADVVQFKARAEILLLVGEGKLTQGGNTIENDRIEFNLRTGNLKAGGRQAKGRVEVILQPAEQKK